MTPEKAFALLEDLGVTDADLTIRSRSDKARGWWRITAPIEGVERVVTEMGSLYEATRWRARYGDLCSAALRREDTNP